MLPSFKLLDMMKQKNPHSVTKAHPKTLIAITTFNHCDYTRLCLDSLIGSTQNVKVFDDCSTDGTRVLCQEYGIPFVSNHRPRGLTSLWNLAFSDFVEGGYDNLVITNNDILFPQAGIDQLEHDLELHPYVGILTREDDSPLAEHQAIEHYTDLSKDEVNQPNKLQEVQDKLVALDLPPVSIKWIYGFCFGLSRKVIPYAYSHNTLVDQRLINTRQEQYLCKKIPSKMLCRRVFAYHFKGVSCGPFPISWRKDFRDDLHRYHKTGVSLRLRIRIFRNRVARNLDYYLRKIKITLFPSRNR